MCIRDRRERELPAFRLYRMRARSQSMVDGNAYELLLDLFETKIEQLADEIENRAFKTRLPPFSLYFGLTLYNEVLFFYLYDKGHFNFVFTAF